MLRRVLAASLIAFLLAAPACGIRNGEGGRRESGEPGGQVLSASKVEKVAIGSEILDKEMRFNIYLPKGYGGDARYPVLYMIHGYGGNEDTWIPGLELDKRADELIAADKLEPLIIVAPQMDNSWGINSSEHTGVIGTPPNNTLNEGRYEDYLCQELVPYIDSSYNTSASRDKRYIGGLSMGGFIALHAAFRNADMFGKAGGHSPAVVLDNTPDIAISWLYPEESQRKERDPLQLAKEKDLKGLKVYLDCGDNDYYRFYEGCERLYELLRSEGVEAVYHLKPGSHDGAYWHSNAEEYLLFYAGR